MTESDILHSAIDAFQRETGITIKAPTATDQHHTNPKQDVAIVVAGKEYLAQIKAWAQHGNIGAIIERVQRNANGLLLADYVNPRMADRLHGANIQFIDASGNAYITTDRHHVWIKGNKKATIEGYPAGKPRMLTKAALKVIYAVLLERELIAAPYRTIAKTAEVSLGTVGQIVQDLQTRGFLVTKKGRRSLVRVEALFQLWIDRYPETLRPALFLGTFKADDADWWKRIHPAEFNAQWGGEIAAALYTDYLRPKVATIYIPKRNQMHLVAAAKLRKIVGPAEEPGLVEMLLPLARQEGHQTDKCNEPPVKGRKGVVPPILAYADLIATGDPRNLEAALIIYEDRIAKHLGQA